MPVPDHLIAVANSAAASHDEGGDDRFELLLTLGQSLHRVGQPAHRLEDTIVNASARMNIHLDIFALPTGMIMSFADHDGHETRLLRIQNSTIHLERLARLSNVADKLCCGWLTPADGKLQLERTMAAPERWGPVSVVTAYILSAAAFSVFFGGGWIELLTATCVGLAVGLLAVITSRVQVSRRLFELSSSLAAAWIATAAEGLVGQFVDWIPLAAGLIILLPGMATVDSVEELANGHLVSGAARLAGVIVVFLAITFGAVIGVATASLLPAATADANSEPLPYWITPVALVAVSIGSMIRFRAKPTDLVMVLSASFLAFYASRFGAQWLGPLAGAFLASFALGAVANVLAIRLRQPVELFTVPGLAILVPGSIGLRSLSSLLSHDTTTGVDDAFHMFLTAMAIVAGLLFSNSFMRKPGVF